MKRGEVDAKEHATVGISLAESERAAAPRTCAGFVGQVVDVAHRRPLLAAVLVVVPLILLAIVVFRPSYDTNDDPTMSLIVAGNVVCEQPDEHMVFTHFSIGLVLKQLYLLAPAIPWYGIYLFSVHACAHIALVYLLFKQRVGSRWLLVYLAYALIVGLLFLNALQFTTTAFLAAQSGFLLALFAFVQAAHEESFVARRCGIAGAALLLLAALIRWHVFMMFFSLAIPTACVLAWSYRHQTRVIVTAAALTALTLAGLYGTSMLNDAYYERDPRWSDFYSYNELRARINDLQWVYYSPQTAHVFPQVGWSVNDFGMIQAWFYDDPAVYNAAKLKELLDAYPWQESKVAEHGATELLTALANDPNVAPLLALTAFVGLMLGRNRRGHAALLLTFVWVCGMLWIATVLRKPPPPRVYLPILSFPSALALTLGASLRSCTTPRTSSSRLLTALAARLVPHRKSLDALRQIASTLCTRPRDDALAGGYAQTVPGPLYFFPNSHSVLIALRLAIPAACIFLGAFAVIRSLGSQFDRRARTWERSQAFYDELASISSQPDILFVGWGASVPFELLDPLDNLQGLSNLHMLQFGWTQQCPFHADMKRRFGIEDLPREIADRSDVVLISHPACIPLMVNYIREHHGREVQFKETGRFAAAVVTLAAPRAPGVTASRRDLHRQ